MARLRQEYFHAQRAYPFERIPEGALRAGREEALAVWSESGMRASTGGSQWESMGPVRIPHFSTSTGRATTIALHPRTRNTIYIGGAQGGVWRSDDSGRSWQPLTDHQCSLAMGSIVLDPVNPNIVYAGTGELNFSGSDYYGCGILRSVDGGRSWRELGDGVLDLTGRAGARISKLLISPSSAGAPSQTTLYVGSNRGFFVSYDGGESLHRTIDAVVSDIAMNPSNERILYAGVWGEGVYLSIDGGIVWMRTPSGIPSTDVGQVALAVSKSNPWVLYAAIASRSTRQLLGLYKTEDAGLSWSKVDASGLRCAQCWYNLAIAVDPTDSDIVYFGAIEFYRSRDGGQTFDVMTGPIHVDQHAIVIDPKDPSTLYVANDGGIYRSRNRAESWESLNTNLALTQFYSGASPHPLDPSIAFGGTQDNGTLRFRGSADWDHVLFADGGFTAIDEEDPNIVWAETQWVRGGFGGPWRSTSGGADFHQASFGINHNDIALFIPPLVISQFDPKTVYFGTRELYRRRDRESSWMQLSEAATFSGSISAIAPAPSEGRIVYVGTASSRVYVTSDDAVTWDRIGASIFPNRWVRDIAVHPHDPDVAYVVFSGYGEPKVFRTSDRGTTWSDRTGVLPNVPVNSVLIDPAQPETIFIGTDLGVFISPDEGVTWNPFNEGLPNVAVIDLAVSRGTGVMVAATHGRGMFRTQRQPAGIEFPIRLTVEPSEGRVDAPQESRTSIVGRAAIHLRGGRAQQEAWQASTDAPWIDLLDADGEGSASLAWLRDPTGLPIGSHVAEISVRAGGVSVSIFDSLVVQPSPLTLSGLAEPSRSTEVEAGSVVADSARVEIVGEGAPGATWSALDWGSPWLRPTRSEGTRDEPLHWLIDTRGLRPGTFGAAIGLTVVGALGSPARLDHQVTVRGFTVEEAARVYFEAKPGDQLGSYLDGHGNANGTLDLPDLLAWYQWCTANSTVCEVR